MRLDSGGTESDPVTVTAVGDVYLTEAQGDLALGSITATGDLTLSVPTGSLIDALADSGVGSYDDEAISALLALWSNAGLIGATAVARKAEVIASYQQAREAEYALYWDSFDATSDSMLAHDRVALGMGEDQIADIVAKATARRDSFAPTFGPGGTYAAAHPGYDATQRDSAFTYELTADEEAQLTDGLVRSADDLLWSLSSGAVRRTADTETAVETPNIVARNVTADVGLSFGHQAGGVQTVYVPGGKISSLSDEDLKVALMSAEADDLAFLLWTDADGDGAIDDAELAAWQDADGDTTVDADEFNVIQIYVREDVDVQAGGRIRISAGDGVFLGSEQDVNIDQIDSYSDQGRGDVRIKVGGNVQDGSSGNAPNVVAAGLVVESSDGDIGSALKPFVVDLSGTLTARSSGDVHVEAIGDLSLAGVYAEGTASLTGSGSLLDANDGSRSTVTDIVAASVYLGTASVGILANPIEVEVSGTLGGLASGAVYTSSPTALTVDSLESTGGDLHVTSTLGLSVGLVRSVGQTIHLTSTTGSITDGNGEALNVYGSVVVLEAARGSVGSAADTLEIDEQTTSFVTAKIGSYVDAVPRPTGTFVIGDRVTALGGHQALDVRLVDFNGDGNLDVFADGRVLINAGDGTFAQAASFVDDSTIGDVDGDGDIDVVAWNDGGKTMDIWLNDGDGAFSAGRTFDLTTLGHTWPDAHNPTLADMDGDGRLDLIIPGHDDWTGVTVVFNDGAGSFKLYSAISLPYTKTDRFTPVDIDGDRDLDLVVIAYLGSRAGTPTSIVFLNDGDGGLSRSGQSFYGVYDAATGDVDRDGDTDLVLAGIDGSQVWLNNGFGTFANSGQSLGTGLTRGVALADLDLDGDLDGFFAVNTATYTTGAPDQVWMNDGNGIFTDSGQRLTGDSLNKANAVALGDLDGDGDVDAFVGVASWSGGSEIWLNQAPPRLSSGQSLEVTENALPGSVVGTLRAKDRDANDSLTYTMTVTAVRRSGGSTDLTSTFVLDPATGAISVAAGANLDYETFASITAAVTIRDRAGLVGTGTTSISLRDVIWAPAVSGNLSVPENCPAGTVVGRVSVSDADIGDRAALYELIGGDTDVDGDGIADFTIDSATGLITFVGASLDREADPTRELLVRVTDSEGLSGHGLVAVSVADVNEVPVIAEVDPRDNFYRQTYLITENHDLATPIARVSAVDPEGGTITYQLVNLGGWTVPPSLRIDSTTGDLYVASAGDIDPDSLHDFLLFGLSVSDGIYTSVAFVRIDVLDFDAVPVFNDVTAIVAEHGTDGFLVTTLTAYDADVTNGDTLSYSIVTGNNAGLFNLDAASGRLTVLGSQLDVATAMSYTLVIEARDSDGLSDFATVTVKVADVGSRPTLANATFQIGENPEDDATLGFLSVTDADPGDSTFFQILSGNELGGYAIDPATGEIFIASGAVLDYEDAAARTTTLMVRVTDRFGLNDEATVTIGLTDYHNAPVSYSVAGLQIPETVAVGRVYVSILGGISDGDLANGDRLTYSFTWADGSTGHSTDPRGIFSMNPKTGDVTVIDNSRLDYEAGGVDQLSNLFRLVITDTEGQSFVSPLVDWWFVRDVAETPAIAVGQRFSISEASGTGAVVGTVAATGLDTGDTFTIFGGDGMGLFAVDATSGRITVADGSALDFEAKGSYQLQVMVSGGGQYTASVVNIDLADVFERDVSVTKTTDAGPSAQQGDELEYTITVRNHGDGAEAVTVSDPFTGLTGLTLMSVAGTLGATSSLAPGALPGGLNDAASLPWNATLTYVVRGTVATAGAGSVAPGGMLLGSAAAATLAVADTSPSDNSARTTQVLVTASGGGSGEFLESIAQNNSDFCYDVVTGDLDGDGDVDALIAVGQSWVWRYLNDGQGHFTIDALRSGGQMNAIALGDVDGDGDMDFMTTNERKKWGYSVWTNDGSGNFADTTSFPSGDVDYGVNDVALVDLDGDGDLDGVLGAYNRDPYLLINNGQGTFTTKSGSGAQNTVNPVSFFAPGDFDGDGDVDLAVARRGSNGTGLLDVWTNNGTGSFTTTQTTILGNTWGAKIRAGDLNGDGSIDLFVQPNEEGFDDRIYFNNGHAHFSADSRAFPGGYDGDAALADLDGDGDLDILAVDSTAIHRIYHNDGSGSFTLFAEMTGATSNTGVAVGDVDGDGDLDAFVVNRSSDGQSRVYFNLNRPTITAPTAASTSEETSLSISSVVVADSQGRPLTLSVSIPASAGTLTLDGQTASSLTFVGTQESLNELLAGLRYTPAGEFNGEVALTIFTQAGLGAREVVVPITVEAVNDAPTLGVPATLTTQEDTVVGMSGLVVSDVETDTVKLTLTTADGLLQVGGQTGRLLRFDARTDEITALLAGLSFMPAANFNGTALVTATLQDGPHTLTKSFSVGVTPVNDAPAFSLPASIDVTRGGQVNLSSLSVGDVDGGALTLTLTATNGTVTLAGVTGTSVTLTGSAVSLNTALAEAYFRPVSTLLGSAGLTVSVDDGAFVSTGSIAVDARLAVLRGATTSLTENADVSARTQVAEVELAEGVTASLTGSDAARFELDGTTLYLKAGASLNFESDASLDVSLDVAADDASQSISLSLQITDVNETPDLSLTGATSAMPETTFDGRLRMATIDLLDDALGNNQLYLTGLDAYLFDLDGDGLYLAPGVVLDYETNPDLDVTVVVDDLTTSQPADASVSLHLQLTDVNEAPVVTMPAEQAIAENETNVTTVTATDEDAGTTFVYSLTGGADASLFTIDAATGALAFATGPDHENPLDADGDNAYEVTVGVSDSSQVTNLPLVVRVTDFNEWAPVITSNGGGAAASVSIAENATAVTTVTSTDADGTAERIYTIAGGADADRFSIDATTGALRFLTAPNHEAPADSGANNVYDVIVRASDGTLSDDQAVAVAVTNLNEAPVITSNGGGATASVSLAENAAAVTTVTSTDADGTAERTYTIVGGADAARFSIDATTGALAFASAPNHEAPADSGANNVYDVIVRVSDGTLSDDQAIAVTVTNLNEAPVITSNGGPFSVVENQAMVTGVVATDTEGSSVRYSIIGGADASRFAINTKRGTLTFLSPPNYEAPTDADGDNAYEVTVGVSDSSQVTNLPLVVRVTDFNEWAPVITSNGGGAAASVSIAENATAVTTVTSIDADGTAESTYTIVGGADAARFSIDATTGALRFLTAPNHEAPADSGANNVYDVIVRASDGTLSDDQAIAVTVTNLNEAPVITSNGGGATASVSIAENATAVTTVTSNDPDAGATRTYSIAGGADVARFAVDATTGALRFLTAPNHEAPADSGANNVYDVIVRASDGTLSDDQAIAVAVTNLNEAPVIASNGGGATASVSIAENATAVTTVTSTDPDAGATRTYGIAGGADAARFSIDATTGALRFLTAPNHEAPADSGANNVYDVIVRASDGTLSDDQAITVAVTNLNEAPVITSNGGGATASVSIAENATAVTTVTSTDPDAGATKTYSIAGGADAARFSVNATTGALMFNITPDYEYPFDQGGDNTYDVVLQVSDGLLTAKQTITVNVTNNNDSTPYITNENFGSTSLSSGTYTIQGSGANVGGTTDEFHFAQAQASTSAAVVARVASISGTNSSAVAGVMFRNGMAVNAANVLIYQSKGGLIVFQSRSSTGGSTTVIASTTPSTSINWLRIQRSGNTFTGSYSSDGTNWTTLGSTPVPMTDARAGLAVNSHVNSSTLATATFDNVSLTGTKTSLTGIDIGGAVAVSKLESTTDVSKLVAADADNNNLTYSINGGTDASKFSINSVSGELTFISAPSASTPTDSNSDNIYQVIVQATDGTYTGSRTLNIRVVSTGTASSTPLALDSYFNRRGIVSDGSTFTNGWDGDAAAYSRTLLGTSRTWDGTTFTLGTSTNNAMAAAGQSIEVPTSQQGQYASLKLLASGVNGNQANQTFTVWYTDNTSETFTQSLSDWFNPQSYSGESKAVTMSYRDKSNGTLDNRTFYLYGYTLSLNTSKTFWKVILPNNTNVVLTSMTITTTGASQVDLSSYYNAVGLTNAATTTGLDGVNNTFDSASIGTTIVGLGTQFTLGTANQNNAVSSIGQTIAVTRGRYKTLRFLATAVDGNQANQTFTVTYTDGTSQTFTQGISDWVIPQSYSGQTTVKKGKRKTAGGVWDGNYANIYGYSFSLDGSKTIKSITLPNNAKVKIFGLNLVS